MTEDGVVVLLIVVAVLAAAVAAVTIGRQALAGADASIAGAAAALLGAAAKADAEQVRQLDLRRAVLLETDTERRRIMRDLHDGAQQQLVALRVRIGLATDAAVADSDRHLALVQMAADLDTTIAELRELARSLVAQPWQNSVAPALRDATRYWPMDVRVRNRQLSHHDADVQAAVYGSCLEALQSARASAEAGQVGSVGVSSSAVVSLFETEAAIHFIVRGTGVAFDPASANARQSLARMVDRVSVAGGSLSVASAHDRSVVMRGSIPLTRGIS